ncbi:MAG: sugar transferase [Rhodobacterales bacterium]|nr:sugar transferase [Rhodobacterales bacterium]
MTYQDRAAYPSVAFPRPITLSERPAAAGIYRRFAKRALDIAIVAVVSLPVAMVVLLLALLVATDGRSPFYMQARVGRGGRLFRMVKLRTMVWQADRVLDGYLASNPAARAEWDRDQKLRHDPRVTRIGALLRRSSLDELPQLWNVLRGDMSIVGPRPMMDSQRAIYPGTEYYAMRPGITGFWQVSVRNESSFSERAAFDRRYFHELSLRTDLGVIWRTVGVVLRATGV